MNTIISRDEFATANEYIFFTQHDSPQLIHKHDFYEQIYVFSGSLIVTIDSKPVNVNTNQLIVINKNIPYQVLEQTSDTKYLCFGYTNKAFRNLVSMSALKTQIIKISELLVIEEWDYGISDCSSSDIHRVFEDISNLENNQGNYRSVLLELKFMEYIIYFLEDKDLLLSIRKSKNDVLNYIVSNLRTASLKEFADLNHISVSKASKDIKSTYKMSFMDIKHEVQMQESIVLLANPNVSIEQILDQIGVVNKTHFYKIFKQHFGLTPKQYRETKLVDTNAQSNNQQ